MLLHVTSRNHLKRPSDIEVTWENRGFLYFFSTSFLRVNLSRALPSKILYNVML